MGSIRYGAVIFTTEMLRLADFYARIIGLNHMHVGDDHIVLEGDGFRLTLHKIPGASGHSTPPRVREAAAIKPTFPVASIAEARRQAPDLGGAIYGADKEWRWDGTLCCDGHDPDGNVFLLTEIAG